MAGDGEALTRLGGGRWRTKDERFTIEPQGGSWVVVDGEQTDELGLALVRGPFGSLTAAREAIEAARAGEVPVSPLAARIEEAKDRPPPARPKRPPAVRRGPAPRPDTRSAAPPDAPAQVARPAPPPPPPPPAPEPAWIGALPAAKRRTARALIERLASLDVEDPEDVARSEVERGEPALARLAVQRAVAAVVAGKADREAALAAVVALLTEGDDDALGVRWRLVDGEGRPIRGASG